MLGKTHRGFGFACITGVLCAAYPIIPGFALARRISPALVAPTQIGLSIAAAIIGSTLPDIDQKLGTTHRGLTHALWIPAILAFLSFRTFRTDIWIFAATFGLLVGYLSHLVGDAFSSAGIAWFYPFQQYRHFGTGAFKVKGFRGPFLPIYHVGDPVFAFMPVVWWVVGAAFLVFFVWKVFLP